MLPANIYAKESNIPENLYKDLFITAIEPNIQNAINQYYNKYLNENNLDHVAFDISSVDILQAKKTNGFDLYAYVVKLRVMPYVGPHNNIGTDILTFKIGNLENNIVLLEYEHNK
jgi:hypothetical protein